MQDWEKKKTGIEDVIKENIQIFQNFPKIEAVICDIAISESQVMAQLEVKINEIETINVIDVFLINNGKISGIKAYKN